jgi:hypothetical protein
MKKIIISIEMRYHSENRVKKEISGDNIYDL